jgi:hypothetical protein
VFLIFQTLAGVWVVSGLVSSLHQVVEDNAAAKVTTYSKEDARHEREFMEQKFLLLENKNEEELRRIALLEAQIIELRSRNK